MTFDKFNRMIDCIKMMTGCDEDTAIATASAVWDALGMDADMSDNLNQALAECETPAEFIEVAHALL